MIKALNFSNVNIEEKKVCFVIVHAIFNSWVKVSIPYMGVLTMRKKPLTYLQIDKCPYL